MDRDMNQQTRSPSPPEPSQQAQPQLTDEVVPSTSKRAIEELLEEADKKQKLDNDDKDDDNDDKEAKDDDKNIINKLKKEVLKLKEKVTDLEKKKLERTKIDNYEETSSENSYDQEEVTSSESDGSHKKAKYH